MPEVLRVIARLNLGGPARHVLRIDGPLRELGWRTTVVTGTPELHEPDLFEEGRHAGLDIIRIPQLSRAPSPLRDVSALMALRRLIAERRPDVLHTHTAKAGTLGRLAALSLRTPGTRPALVHTFHGHVLSGYFGPWLSGCAAAVERALARRTERLVAVAPGVGDELVDTFGVGERSRFEIIPPGIDRARTAPDRAAGSALRAELGIADDATLVGLVGRLDPIKDPEAAVKAFVSRPPEAQGARLLVVGSGSLQPAVEAAAAGREDVHLLPARDDLTAIWGAVDVCLLTSRNEGLPQVATEALAAGVPVVAPAVGGLPDLVQHDTNGLLAPPGSVPQALHRVLVEGALRERLTRGARAFDSSPHDGDKVAAALARVYSAALVVRRTLETRRSSGHASPSCGS